MVSLMVRVLFWHHFSDFDAKIEGVATGWRPLSVCVTDPQAPGAKKSGCIIQPLFSCTAQKLRV